MILSDKAILQALKKKEILIKPFNRKDLQPASYDLHMDKNIMYFDKEKTTLIDVKEPVKDYMKTKTLKKGESYILYPGDFIIANMVEITGVDNRHVGRLEGKSSLARLGIIIHATAGFLDPGNKIRLTLEICNLNNLPIRIYEGMKIAQIAFEELDQECERPYGTDGLGSKYYNNGQVKESLMHLNFERKV